MESQRKWPICGFVPAHVLEKVAASEAVDEKSRIACKHTLDAYKVRSQKITTAAAHHPEPQKAVGGQQPLKAAVPVVTKAARQIYNCNATNKLPGTLTRKEGDVRSKDRQINNCYDGFGITRDFYSTVFGRNSLDAKGLTLTGCVHYNATPKSAGYNNAYWDGDLNHMVFGDGDHISFDYFTDSLDVIAHELSHGFVQYSSPLDYEWQSGALNESMADVFGCMVEQWHMRQTVEDADWNVGQTLFPVSFTGSALRTLKAGRAYTDDPVFGTDDQPKHMKDLYKGTEDNRGVHINSGIPNHAFYLASIAVGGKSWEKVGKVWYKTMTSGRIPPKCEFKAFADVTVDIAGKEFPSEPAVQQGIKGAWTKVGVLT